METVALVKVPDIEHPTLCFKQKLDPPEAMSRCTFPKGHKGEHQWGRTPEQEIRYLLDLVTTYVNNGVLPPAEAIRLMASIQEIAIRVGELREAQ